MEDIAKKIESFKLLRIKCDSEVLVIYNLQNDIFYVTHLPSGNISEWSISDIISWIKQRQHFVSIETMNFTINKWTVLE